MKNAYLCLPRPIQRIELYVPITRQLRESPLWWVLTKRWVVAIFAGLLRGVRGAHIKLKLHGALKSIPRSCIDRITPFEHVADPSRCMLINDI